MNSSFWLVLALPEWYFGAILDPFGAGPLSAVPAFGTLCLFVGLVLGLRRRTKGLLLFLIPAGLCEMLVAVAGAFRGQVQSSFAQPLLLGFLAVQLLISVYLIYRSKGARGAASALTLFSLTYALFASFIAVMAFTDSWL